MRCHITAMNAASIGTGAFAIEAASPAPRRETTTPSPRPLRLEFRALTIRNPFGEGDIEIEEISLSDLSAGGKVALGAGGAGTATNGDGYSRVAGSLERRRLGRLP